MIEPVPTLMENLWQGKCETREDMILRAFDTGWLQMDELTESFDDLERNACIGLENGKYHANMPPKAVYEKLRNDPIIQDRICVHIPKADIRLVFTKDEYTEIVKRLNGTELEDYIRIHLLGYSQEKMESLAEYTPEQLKAFY